MTNGLSHSYHSDESTFIFRGIRSIFSFLFVKANRKAPDGTRQNAASNLGLFCFPMSHKKDARLIGVKLYQILPGEAPALLHLVPQIVR